MIESWLDSCHSQPSPQKKTIKIPENVLCPIPSTTSWDDVTQKCLWNCRSRSQTQNAVLFVTICFKDATHGTWGPVAARHWKLSQRKIRGHSSNLALSLTRFLLHPWRLKGWRYPDRIVKWATKKKPPTFHYTGWFIGILIMYNGLLKSPYNWVV